MLTVVLTSVLLVIPACRAQNSDNAADVPYVECRDTDVFLEGRPMSCMCSAKACWDDQHTITWLQTGKQDQYSTTLTIDYPTRALDGTTYTCQLTCNNRVTRASFILTMLWPADVTQMWITAGVVVQPSAYVKEGSNLTIICTGQSRPLPDVYLTRTDDSINITTNLTSQSDVRDAPDSDLVSVLTYTIPEVRCEDSGHYTCLARNSFQMFAGKKAPSSSVSYLNVSSPLRLQKGAVHGTRHVPTVMPESGLLLHMFSRPPPNTFHYQFHGSAGTDSGEEVPRGMFSEQVRGPLPGNCSVEVELVPDCVPPRYTGLYSVDLNNGLDNWVEFFTIERAIPSERASVTTTPDICRKHDVVWIPTTTTTTGATSTTTAAASTNTAAATTNTAAATTRTKAASPTTTSATLYTSSPTLRALAFSVPSLTSTSYRVGVGVGVTLGVLIFTAIFAVIYTKHVKKRIRTIKVKEMSQ